MRKGGNDCATLPAEEFFGESDLSVEESEEESDPSVEESMEEKHGKKQPNPFRKFVSDFCFTSPFFTNLPLKGITAHPLTQDARQERTAAIRFLQTEALPKI